MPEIVLLTSTETVALIRDIFLIVFLVLGFVALAVLLLFAVSLYRRITGVVEKAERAIDKVESTAEVVEGFIDTAKGVTGLLSFGGVAAKVISRFRRS